MKKLTLSILAIAGAAFIATGAGPAPNDASGNPGTQNYKGAKLAIHAKISLADARKIALKARPGAITDEELEAEKGGSGFRYSFDIKAGQATYEVGVDAQSGRVLENKAEGSHPD